MTKTLFAVLFASFAIGQVTADEYVTNGGLSSLRGSTELNQEAQPPTMQSVIEQDTTYPNAYIFQPPLIPHDIRNYEMSLNANKCMSCHSWKNAPASRATKVSVTHYLGRDGEVLADVSPRRYFCLQCHVPQVDAPELVDNQFEPVESLR
ncbi:nitrate reductase cytochrome c-type subunit [Aliagarivorans taiwanensis]|uniref:nitrate reductase cytochrome c-type subunit n=1 Tax=Aliagarivorans taiwanensis TaxID=561966 RepID=UPI000419F1F1|nr:nitrate reductase cytochrome c-type subunit [Aliagarivorans taiwanensis]